MPVPTWIALPTPPSRGTPTTFADDADTFLGALPAFQTQGNAVAAYAEQMAENAEAAKVAAEAAVANAGYAATSTTSLTIGTGSRSLTVQSARAYRVGNYVVITDAANVANNMFGQVTSYDVSTGAMAVNVTIANGSGTMASWVVGLSGAQGPQAVIAFASAAELRAMTVEDKSIDPKTVADAMEYVALTDASTVAINLANGSHFTLTTTSGVGTNRTLGAPTNGKPGQTFTVDIVTDANSRTMSFASAYKFTSGTVPSITTTSGRRDRLFCQIMPDGNVDANLRKDIR